MKYCSECGYPLNGVEEKCPNCGTEFVSNGQQNNMTIPKQINSVFMNPGEPVSVDTFQRILDVRINPEETLLVDSYHGIMAAMNGDSYDEITLHLGSDGKYYLNEYSQHGTGQSTSHKAYQLTEDEGKKILGGVEKIISGYDVFSWKSLPLSGMMGGKDVVKFRDENNNLVRLSTDQMPMDGAGLFAEISSLLKGYPASDKRVV